MVGNWARVAMRSATKHWLYTATNILGLAVALAAALLIGLFVRHELSYDRFWPEVDRTYRAVADITVVGHPTEASTAVQWPFATALLEGVPDIVESVARVARGRETARIGDASQSLVVTFADPAYLAYFPPTPVAGSLANGLTRPDAAILTVSAARRLFGEMEAVGRTLAIADTTVTVAAVIADRPANSHLDGDAVTDVLLAFASPLNGTQRFADRWDVTPGRVYVRLRPDVDRDAAMARFPDMLDRFRPAAATEVETVVYGLQPVADIHLRSGRYPEGSVRGSEATVAAFAGIAGLILAIAAINFTNLGTALAHSRAKEIGVRKVLGARRPQLVAQLMGEAVATALVALLLAVAAAELLLPWFSGLMGRPLAAWSGPMDPLALAVAVVIALAVGCAGGLYPALHLTSVDTAAALKGDRGGTGQGRVGLRGTLVLVQFAISIALTVATIVVAAQMHLLHTTDMGYQRERMLALLGLPPGDTARAEIVRDRLAALPGVESVALTDNLPTWVPESYWAVRRPDASGPVDMAVFIVGANLFQTLGIDPVAGRLPEPGRAEDELAPASDTPQARAATLVLNEAGARFLGFPSPQAAIGQQLMGGGTDYPITWTVVGVIPDVRFGTTRDTVKATMYPTVTVDARNVVVRLAPGGAEAALPALAAAWAELVPGVPFRTVFIEDRYATLYAQEDRQAGMLTAFAGLAIFIACLGLFALAAFTAERRTKEIGIRKVLGATVADIVRLLVWQFSKPVLLANLIAWPVAWAALRGWLEGYVLRIDLHPGFFLAAGATALVIAWVTVGLQAVRVAQARPVLALRYE